VAANAFFAMQSQVTGVFNVANGHSTSINRVLKKVCFEKMTIKIIGVFA
jgi:hypothetical protein